MNIEMPTALILLSVGISSAKGTILREYIKHEIEDGVGLIEDSD